MNFCSNSIIELVDSPSTEYKRKLWIVSNLMFWINCIYIVHCVMCFFGWNFNWWKDFVNYLLLMHFLFRLHVIHLFCFTTLGKICTYRRTHNGRNIQIIPIHSGPICFSSVFNGLYFINVFKWFNSLQSIVTWSVNVFGLKMNVTDRNEEILWFFIWKWKSIFHSKCSIGSIAFVGFVHLIVLCQSGSQNIIFPKGQNAYPMSIPFI